MKKYGGTFTTFAEIGGIYKFCGDIGEYAICIIVLGVDAPENRLHNVP